MMFEAKHEMIKKLAREFAENEIAPVAIDADATGEYPQELWDKVARYGFTGITIPKEYGGMGGDYKSLVLAMEEFAAKDVSAGSFLMSNSLSGAPYLYFGNEEQKQKYLKPLAQGKTVASFGLTEPGAGCDSGSVSTTAVEDGDYYILNGRKTFITMAPLCDYAVIFAKTDMKAGTRGITAFIVESKWDGFSTGKPESKMGIHASVTSDIILENVRVPKENILGQIGKGFNIAMSILDAGRVTVAAQSLGAAKGALDCAVEYSKERVQFGRAISKFQNTQFTLADMATKVEAARQLVYSAADKLDNHQKVTTEAAMAKYYASETAVEVANKSLQIHGGYGYMREYAIERIYRDARILPIYEGTSEIQKLVISRNVLAD
ncbi:MAG: acyl-CoA dehydrogenase family protein [Eubacterium sp.]|nr:acyl-CoA dehydrogenase family protein [Eubacterium sp.]